MLLPAIYFFFILGCGYFYLKQKQKNINIKEITTKSMHLYFNPSFFCLLFYEFAIRELKNHLQEMKKIRNKIINVIRNS